MKNMRNLLTLTMAVCSIGSVSLLSGCTQTDYEDVMVKGKLLNTEVKSGDLFFTFATKDGTVYENYDKDLDYTIKIDNQLKQPKLTYSVPYEIKEDLNGKEISRKREYKEDKVYDKNVPFTDATKIVISMNEYTYYEIFGKKSSNKEKNGKNGAKESIK